MEFIPVTDNDRSLIDTAQQVLRDNYVPGRHTCSAAVRAADGDVYTGVSIQSSGYGVCAEPVALGTMFTRQIRSAKTIVVVARRINNYPIVPPCGNCRQLLLDYVPDIEVILDISGEIHKTIARNLLPGISLVDDAF